MNPFQYGCVVGGENFCPRPELEKQLREFAESGQNLVIQGARRMGKTSLVQHAIGGMKKMRLVYVDLYGIRSVADFCARTMKGVAKASGEISFLKKAVRLAFRLRPVIAIDPHDGSTTISVDSRAAADPDSLGQVMATLARLAEDGRVCIVFDEFQDVLKLENARGVLAEMRSAIQFQSGTPYFFTGSVRNEMMSIFDDADSPFYKSALPFAVEEIEPASFMKFLAGRFRKGDRKIGDAVLARILEFADGVAGDVQELCEALWETTAPGSEITSDDFDKAFRLLFSRELGGYEAVVERLTPGQHSVLRAMAVRGGSQVYSHEFASLAGLSTSSIRRIVDRLVSDRILFFRKGVYRFSNPFFREWLARQG